MKWNKRAAGRICLDVQKENKKIDGCNESIIMCRNWFLPRWKKKKKNSVLDRGWNLGQNMGQKVGQKLGQNLGEDVG